MHGVVMPPGRVAGATWWCEACQEIASNLGCEVSEFPYLFAIDPKNDLTRWWLRYCPHEHVADPKVTDRNVCTICYQQNW